MKCSIPFHAMATAAQRLSETCSISGSVPVGRRRLSFSTPQPGWLSPVGGA